MATALYRRYRPERFADVIGQEHVTEPLMQALRTGRVGHAYLFSGPRGCGKTTSARILARCLNCEQGPTPEPCGECEACVAIQNATSLDVIEMDAASNNSVDDIRELRESVAFAPVSGGSKVYILDEAHMLSTQAWNAFLKTLEEPPPNTIFVLATTASRWPMPAGGPRRIRPAMSSSPRIHSRASPIDAAMASGDPASRSATLAVERAMLSRTTCAFVPP